MTKGFLFFDYDGTLSNNMQPPTKKVIDALIKAQSAGYKIFICSGRCRAMMPDLSNIPFDGFVLACGTDVRVNGKQIVEHLCTPDQLEPCCRLALSKGKLFIAEGEKFAVSVGGTSYWPDSPEVDSFEKLAEKYGVTAKINKFSIMAPCGEEFKKAAESSGFTFIDHIRTGEFVPKGFTKATGIQAVLDHFGASRNDVIAFGDSMNDYDMLTFAKVGVAMGNAVDELKAAADVVTSSVADDGVAGYINNVLLISERRKS